GQKWVRFVRRMTTHLKEAQQHIEGKLNILPTVMRILTQPYDERALGMIKGNLKNVRLPADFESDGKNDTVDEYVEEHKAVLREVSARGMGNTIQYDEFFNYATKLFESDLYSDALEGTVRHVETVT